MPAPPRRRPRILFILKFREAYGEYCGHLSSGLYNSARFVVEMLTAAGIEARLVQVCDNNDIDRHVHNYRPTHVVIEGLWVVPEKFDVLRPLHPGVTWIVRIHSEIPFLAMEGVALDWIARYVAEKDVFVAMNSHRGFRDVQGYVDSLAEVFDEPDLDAVLYLPNYYPPRESLWEPKDHPPSQLIRIGCFGAIRPLKNQLIQALAAIEFAERKGKRLRFYMNGRDSEQGGDQVLKNLRALFENTGHELVLRAWMPHEDFLGILDLLDVGMAVSFTESFCICAADMVSFGVPVVVSPEVHWASSLSKAEPTNSASIVETLERVTGSFSSGIRWINRRALEHYSDESMESWLKYLQV